MRELAEGVWVDSGPVSFIGLQMTSTMTVMTVGDGLLLYSPVVLTPERRTAVEALGEVRHLYAPNLFHHLHVGDWSAAFPDARVHAPRGLAKKRPDLRIDRLHGEGESGFADAIEEHVIAGSRLGETALFHKPSRTAAVADLVHNVGRPDHGWTRFYTKAMGFYDRVAMSRMLRWTSFSDRRAARGSVDKLLATGFERLVVGHGEPVTEQAADVLIDSMRWLPAA